MSHFQCLHAYDVVDHNINNRLGFKAAGDDDWGGYDDCNKLCRLKDVSLWNFDPVNVRRSKKAGNVSTSVRSTERCIKANLVDPSIDQHTKTSYLIEYRSFIVSLLKPGRKDHPE